MIPDLILNPLMQGSGLGPVAYILNASVSDLCSAHQSNLIFKYVDNSYLIVSDTHLVLASDG